MELPESSHDAIVLTDRRTGSVVISIRDRHRVSLITVDNDDDRYFDLLHLIREEMPNFSVAYPANNIEHKYSR